MKAKEWFKEPCECHACMGLVEGLHVIGTCGECVHWENGEQDSAMVSTCGLRLGTWKRDDGCKLWEKRG